MIRYHIRALKEYQELDISVRKKFTSYFEEFTIDAQLKKEKFKKLRGTELYEFRVKVNSEIYRAIGGFITPDFIVVVIFKKQTQKTPLNICRLANKRYKEILNNY